MQDSSPRVMDIDSNDEEYKKDLVQITIHLVNSFGIHCYYLMDQIQMKVII